MCGDLLTKIDRVGGEVALVVGGGPGHAFYHRFCDMSYFRVAQPTLYLFEHPMFPAHTEY